MEMAWYMDEKDGLCLNFEIKDKEYNPIVSGRARDNAWYFWTEEEGYSVAFYDEFSYAEDRIKEHRLVIEEEKLNAILEADMFGYVRPHVPALRVGEYEYYRAVYCGICKSHSEVSGSASRLALSYDAVFLALTRLVLTGDTVAFSRQRCAANPLAKRTCAKSCEQTRYAAAATSLLTALKFDDDLTDERGMRRFAARMGRLASNGWKRKVGNHYPELSKPVADALAELYRAEAAAQSTLTTAAKAAETAKAAVSKQDSQNDDCPDAFAKVAEAIAVVAFALAHHVAKAQITAVFTHK